MKLKRKLEKWIAKVKINILRSKVERHSILMTMKDLTTVKKLMMSKMMSQQRLLRKIQVHQSQRKGSHHKRRLKERS